MSDEPRDHRLKRLRMRSMRRGIKEMDLILVAYADQRLGKMEEAELDLYDRLLHENDQDLYLWVTGRDLPPEPYRPMIAEISRALAPR